MSINRFARMQYRFARQLIELCRYRADLERVVRWLEGRA